MSCLLVVLLLALFIQSHLRLRRVGKRLILLTIRERGVMSGLELLDATELRSAAGYCLLAELLDQGLLEVHEEG